MHLSGSVKMSNMGITLVKREKDRCVLKNMFMVLCFKDYENPEEILQKPLLQCTWLTIAPCHNNINAMKQKLHKKSISIPILLFFMFLAFHT